MATPTAWLWSPVWVLLEWDLTGQAPHYCCGQLLLKELLLGEHRAAWCKGISPSAAQGEPFVCKASTHFFSQQIKTCPHKQEM